MNTTAGARLPSGLQYLPIFLPRVDDRLTEKKYLRIETKDERPCNKSYGFFDTEKKILMNPSKSWTKLKSQPQVFPNPTNGNLQITHDRTIFTVEVYDTFGQIVKAINHIDNKTVFLQLAECAPGVYVVHIQAEDGVKSKRIQITK